MSKLPRPNLIGPLIANACIRHVGRDDRRIRRTTALHHDRLQLPPTKSSIHKSVRGSKEVLPFTHRYLVRHAEGEVLRNIKRRIRFLVTRVPSNRRRLEALQELRPRVGDKQRQPMACALLNLRLQRVVRAPLVLRLKDNRPQQRIRPPSLSSPTSTTPI